MLRSSVVFVALLLVDARNAASQSASSRDQRWREDIAFIATELPARHINAFAYLDRAAFAREAKTLEDDVSRLSDARVQLRIARLTALIRDVHTSSPLPTYERRLPLAVFWFDEGPVIVNAISDQRTLIGARILGVNGREFREVADTLRLYLSSENELGFRMRVGTLLLRPQALRDVGIGADTTSTTLEIDRNGVVSIVTVPAVPATGFTLPAGEAPLYRQRPGDRYWWTYMPNERTVFVKYNQCRDPDDFRRMTDSVARAIDAAHPLRVVVDLRDNTGGNSSVTAPLIEVLKSKPEINRPDALFVIIGRQTLSSGLFAAVDLKSMTHATVVGEPTGERPNHYGEQRSFVLPNSKLMVTYSTKFHHLVEKNSEAYEPDVMVPPTSTAYLRGVDPVIQWILAHSRTSE